MLYDFQVFGKFHFPNVIGLLLVSSLIALWSERIFCIIWILLNLLIKFTSGYSLSWRMFYMSFKRMCFLILLVRMFYKYEIQLVSGIFCLLFLYMTERSVEILQYNFRFTCFSSEFCQFFASYIWKVCGRVQIHLGLSCLLGKLTLLSLCSVLLCTWQLSFFWSLFCLRELQPLQLWTCFHGIPFSILLLFFFFFTFNLPLDSIILQVSFC